MSWLSSQNTEWKGRLLMVGVFAAIGLIFGWTAVPVVRGDEGSPFLPVNAEGWLMIVLLFVLTFVTGFVTGMTFSNWLNKETK